MRIRIAGVLTAAVVTALLPATPAGAALGPKWTAAPEVPLPVTSTGAELRDVTAISAADVWVVGVWRNATQHPLAAHWNGTGWAVATVPDPAGVSGQYDLQAIDAAASRDVWAVGSAQSTAADLSVITTTLVLHYDGQTWAVVPSPSSLSTGSVSVLSDVDMVSAGDGWAVGRTAVGAKPEQAVILRWQSGQWVKVAVPAVAASSTQLSAVYARSADDAWAVGSQLREDGVRASLVLHWDGVSWQQVPVPVAGTGDDSEFLMSVSALTATDVWAVGRVCQTITGLTVCRPLALRLSGGTWQVVPTAGGGTELTEVIPFSSTDVWVVGYTSLSALAETDYAEHWDGQRFTADATVVVPPAAANGQPASALAAAAAVPATGELWAVGWVRDPKRGATHAVVRG